jgi:hypothetical protein
MTEKETKIGRQTRREASAQEKPEREQMEAQPGDEATERLESAASDDAKTDSTKMSSDSVGAAQAIEEGVDLVGEEAPEVASIVVHKVKKGISVAYGTSSTFVRQAYHSASDYADKYKHKIEIKRLKAKRETLSSRLGSVIYTGIVIDQETPEKLFLDEEISSLLEQIQHLDDEVVTIGKELEKH